MERSLETQAGIIDTMFLARDFIVTTEGLVFAVTLNGLEEGRVVACLRYVPEAEGLRKVDTREAEEILRRYPHYRYHSPRRDVVLQAVPLERIRRHLQPRRRLQALLAGDYHDPLIRRLRKIVDLLADQKLNVANLGITGSLLVGAHTLRSDLDLVCYGARVFDQARDAVRRLTADGRLQDLSRELWYATWRRRNCALDFPTWLWHERRKHTKGAIDGTKFDLILAEETVVDDPRPWRKQGRRILRATVVDAGAAFATPARYRLDHPEIPEVLCFTATYLGQARRGETVEISGQVEVSPAGERRMIVGASREAPGEYIRVIGARGDAHV